MPSEVWSFSAQVDAVTGARRDARHACRVDSYSVAEPGLAIAV